MSSHDVEYVENTAAERPAKTPVALKDMPSIQSQVTFGVGGGGAIIGVGPVAADATKVEVLWGTTLVYSATTPNLPEQSAIPATVVSGTTYTLKLKLWYAGWTRCEVYTGNFTAVPGTIVVLLLNPYSVGGP